MPIAIPPTVDDEPVIELRSWRVMQTERCERHFVGVHGSGMLAAGRVSSAIVSFDASQRRGVTRSGRVYILRGAPGGLDGDAAYTWAAWARFNRVASYEDVTHEFEAEAARAAAEAKD